MSNRGKNGTCMSGNQKLGCGMIQVPVTRFLALSFMPRRPRCIHRGAVRRRPEPYLLMKASPVPRRTCPIAICLACGDIRNLQADPAALNSGPTFAKKYRRRKVDSRYPIVLGHLLARISMQKARRRAGGRKSNGRSIGAHRPAT